MEIKKLYDAPAIVDIGNRVDNDPPVNEEVFLFKITNAYVSPLGYVIKGFGVLKNTISFRHRDSFSLKNRLAVLFIKKKIKTTQTTLSITHGWHDSYYHFTLECLPKLYLLRSETEKALLVFPNETQLFHRQWLDLLGIKNILFVKNTEVVKSPLVITTSFPARDLNHHPQILPEFRNWVLDHVKDKSSLSFQKIFIGRKNPRHRKLLNQEAVKAMLSAYDFTYIEMEDYSVEDQVKLFYNAGQIISVHGAALSNLCFCKPGTKVIDLLHEDFKQWCFLKLSVILQLDYTVLQCKGTNDHPLPGYNDIEADVEQLKRYIVKWNS